MVVPMACLGEEGAAGTVVVPAFAGVVITSFFCCNPMVNGARMKSGEMGKLAR